MAQMTGGAAVLDARIAASRQEARCVLEQYTRDLWWEKHELEHEVRDLHGQIRDLQDALESIKTGL